MSEEVKVDADSAIIEGIIAKLDQDRTVFAGQIQGDSEVYLRFTNGEAVTRLKLSFEAASELRKILDRISTRGLMREHPGVWVLTSDEKDQIDTW